jgi:hypothetical protein
MVLNRGDVLADGRYSLIGSFGADPRGGMEFWRARDRRVNRDVALTILVGTRADEAAVAHARQVADMVRRTESVAHPALARLLDVLGPDEEEIMSRAGVLGLIVAEWTEGASMADVLRGGPVTPASCRRMLRPLVAAVDRAHHAGLVIGVDPPERVRVSPRGILTLAFPGPSPALSSRDDVRGLGALLYALLTGVWPAQRLVPPAALRSDLPRDLSLVAVLILDETSVGNIRTSGVLLRVLDQTRHDEASTDPLPAVPARPITRVPKPPPEQPTQRAQPTHAAEATPLPAPEPGRPKSGRPKSGRPKSGRPGSDRPGSDRPGSDRPGSDRPGSERPDRRRRQRMTLAAVLTAATIAIVVWTIGQIVGFFGLASTLSATTASQPGVQASTSHSAPQPNRFVQVPPRTEAPRVLAVPIAPASVSEYVVSGSPDNADKIGLAADGNPTTSWKTDNYFEQFPAFEPGLGIMASFAQPVRLSVVRINSPSAGTVVQVRAANSTDPALGDTQVLGNATLSSGDTVIPLAPAAPTSHLLIWITALAHANGGYQSTINEVTFQPQP